LSEEQQVLLELLLSGTESRVIEGYTVVVASATIDHHVSEISSIAHRIRDTLDLSALFILVQMPNTLQFIARSTDEAIDVGHVARLLGGGGHGRAAAASIHDKSIEACVVLIWQALMSSVRPVNRVLELMSYGAHTVDASESLVNVVRQLRRIGHEGYPVVEDGQVIGLLTRRDLDRAVEHGLGQLAIREVMVSGRVTLRPDDSVFMLEQRMVESGWGQIPVVDDAGKLIGIVTRTDLIKHWARIHPSREATEKTLSLQQIENVLGQPPARLIDTISAVAQDKNIKLYLVGGIVRDLLLSRRNLDIDFVLEDNAIHFARGLQSQFGGRVSAFPPFGTAKWTLDESVAAALKMRFDQLPEHIDFATARNEFYEHPTALPTVYNGSIKLDLQRRDFTINTLAVQLSPASVSGLILDFYGGLGDLQERLIRALHSLSFVDDPTRILRAVRFERRLAFTIEARTADLITSALPMLGRITGERVRSELTLFLKEPEPEQGLLELQQRGVLQAIHPAFAVNEDIITSFKLARGGDFPWRTTSLDMADLYWHILAAQFPPQAFESVCERLMFGRMMIDSLVSASRLSERSAVFSAAKTRPSEIARQLAGTTELALLAIWLTNANLQARDFIRNYWTKWRHIHPVATGHTLREMGLPPGPCYSIILNRLRDACLDGEARDEAGERALLDRWIHEEGICDDSP
jgi:tRNA nucleotidyltransferase (CCA-adding enzyme)